MGGSYSAPNHPLNDIVAGGFADGLVVVADITSSRILPIIPPDHGPVSALTWSPDGTRLVVGTETGYAEKGGLNGRTRFG